MVTISRSELLEARRRFFSAYIKAIMSVKMKLSLQEALDFYRTYHLKAVMHETEDSSDEESRYRLKGSLPTRTCLEYLSRLNLDSSLKGTSSQSSSVPELCSRRRARRFFWWLIVKGRCITDCLAYKAAALGLWETVIRYMEVNVELYKLRGGRVALEDISFG
ncbi:hypothetical protein TNCV_3431911 [Trichonephila clavipes]|nr:hypothetical protein TNCV_3431911 [Trichonephila clavipes]